MADIKLSQLASVTSLNNADLLAVSKSITGGNWESKSITAQNVYKSFGSSSRSLKVSQEGVRDASNIKDAVALAVALVPPPSEFDPVIIQVSPGSYYEDNPITIPQWVTIYSEGGIYSSAVIAENDGDIFISSGNNLLNGFTIVGGIAFSNIAYKSTTHTSGQITNCIIINCYNGIFSDNGSIIATFITGLSFQRVFDKFIRSANGGFIAATSCSLTGIITRPVCGYSSSGTGSELYLWSCSVANCVRGISAGQNGYIDVFSAHLDGCDDSIHIGATGN